MNCTMCCKRWSHCQRPVASAMDSATFERLVTENRAGRARQNGIAYWVAADKAKSFRAIFPQAQFESEPADIEAAAAFSRRRAAIHGPRMDAAPRPDHRRSDLAARSGLPASEIDKALLRLEAERRGLARAVREEGPGADRVVRPAAAGADPSPDAGPAAQADRAGDGGAVHALAAALAARRIRQPGAGRAGHAGSAAATARLRDSGQRLGAAHPGAARGQLRSQVPRPVVADGRRRLGQAFAASGHA